MTSSLSKQDLPEENEPIWVLKPSGYYGTPLSFEEAKKRLSKYGIDLAPRNTYRTIYNGWLYGVKYFSETGMHKVWKVKLPEGDMADTLHQQPTLDQIDDTNSKDEVAEIKEKNERILEALATYAGDMREAITKLKPIVDTISAATDAIIPIAEEEAEEK